MDDRSVQVERVRTGGPGWRISGPSFSVTCRLPGQHRPRWQLAVESGEVVEQLNEDGQIVARRQSARYAIGDRFSDVLPALQELDQADRRTVEVALTNQLPVDPASLSVIGVAA